MLGTRQNTRHLPYPAPTQLCTHPISFWCCCRMAETTQQTSATGNKTNRSQTPLTHPRQRHPATLYRDPMTRGALATTSTSPLRKKSSTKGQWFFYYLNAGNYRFLPWWFLMTKDTRLQKRCIPRYRGKWFSTFNSLSGHPQLLQTPISSSFSVWSCYSLFSFKAVISSSHPVFFSSSFCCACCLHQLFITSEWRDQHCCQTWNSWEIFTSEPARVGIAPLSQTQGVITLLVGGITQGVILVIWSSINFTELP